MLKYDIDIYVLVLEWGLKKEKVVCDFYIRVNRFVYKRVVVESSCWEKGFVYYEWLFFYWL